MNQARVVVDGEQIYIPTKEEMQTQAAAQPGASPAEGTKPQDGKVNLNTATKEELIRKVENREVLPERSTLERDGSGF